LSTFGDNLRELRKSRGYSQDKFAREIGSNQMTLSSWEVGTRMPSLQTIKRIADTFHVPVSSLISMESFGNEADADRELLDLIKENSKIKELVSSARYLSTEDIETVLIVAKALVRSKV